MYQQIFTFEYNTASESLLRIQQFIAESVVMKQLLPDYAREEFFLAPGAFLRLLPEVQKLGDDTCVLEKREGDDVGILFGVPCRSPIYIPDGQRDYEGLSHHQVAYRIMEKDT